METVTGYEPRFDFDVRRGQVGEQYVGTILEALTNGSVEVKTDYGVNKTGNVYVEYEQEGRDGVWRPSGLATTEAEVWAFAFSNGAVFVRTDELKRICRTLHKQGAIGFRPGNDDSNATRGIKLPVKVLTDELRCF